MQEMAPEGVIAVGVDGSDGSRRALRWETDDPPQVSYELVHGDAVEVLVHLPAETRFDEVAQR